jgi:hypothetical protein
MSSGVIVERRDQVLMTFLLPSVSIFLTLVSSLSSIYGPFLIERATLF